MRDPISTAVAFLELAVADRELPEDYVVPVRKVLLWANQAAAVVQGSSE